MSAEETNYTIERRDDGRLFLFREGESTEVVARRCFPWSNSSSYISFRKPDGDEVALAPSLSALDDASQAAVHKALGEVEFVLDIERIHEIKTEFEIKQWTVETKQGPMRFQTKLDTWPEPLTEGGYLVRDVADNLLRIPDPSTMDRHSRKALWAYVG